VNNHFGKDHEMDTTRHIQRMSFTFALAAALMGTGASAMAEDSKAPRPDSRYVTPASTAAAPSSPRYLPNGKQKEAGTTRTDEAPKQSDSSREPYVTYDGAENSAQ
jgi:hypothetical protein